jgi:hypothetical protein
MIALLITLLASFGAVALLEMGIRKRGATLGQLSSLLTTSVLLALLGLIFFFRGGFMIGIPALAAAGVAYWRYGQLKLLSTKPQASTKSQAGQAARGNGGDMDRTQALAVLGLAENASDADITAAHRRLITGLHPDQGGSDFLAAQINEARDVLLG